VYFAAISRQRAQRMIWCLRQAGQSNFAMPRWPVACVLHVMHSAMTRPEREGFKKLADCASKARNYSGKRSKMRIQYYPAKITKVYKVISG